MYVKAFILCVSFHLAVLSPANTKNVKIPEELIKKALPIEKKCTEETGSPDNSLRQLMSGAWEGVSADYVKKFTYCFLRRLQYAGEDGHLDVDKLVALVPAEDQPGFERTMVECNKFTGANPMETATGVCGCFFNTQPIRFTID